MEDRVDPTTERELRNYLSDRLDRIPVLSSPRYDRVGGGWLSRAAVVPIALVLVSTALVIGSALGDWREQRVGAPGLSASPSASVRPVPRTSRELGETLAQTFAARDADAVASVLGQGLGVSAVVEPFQQGDPLSEGCCVLNVLAVDFVERLRERFASGALTVTVDPQVQTRTEGGRERSFVSSDWREADRTVRIDLLLEVVNGRWHWGGALHHYQRTQLTQDRSGVTCIPYRTPWVPATSSC